MKRLPNENKLWSWLGKGLIDLAFSSGDPCPVCQQERTNGNGLGKKCLNQIMFIHPPFCNKCGKPFVQRSGERSNCGQCEEHPMYFRQARAVALYDGALREYLAELKYRYRPELGLALGKLLVEGVKAYPGFRKIDLVVPIPIHPHKLAARGYNQAELLARPLQDYLGMKVQDQVLIRTKLTETQNALRKPERFANVKDAFQVVETLAVGGKRVLVIDDILTTGATVSEAARMLLKAGAISVDVLTLATGVIEAQWINEQKRSSSDGD